MNIQELRKQVAREYYNVLYGAKLNYASYDICEKLPTFISLISLSFGVLALGFDEFNSKVLGATLLIIGIVGLLLKPREAMKSEYHSTATELNSLSKKLELIHGDLIRNELENHDSVKEKLERYQAEHGGVINPSPVLLSSWYAHYKVFSEHNSKWMIEELGLTWKDKIPLSLRISILGFIAAGIVMFTCFVWSPLTTAWASKFLCPDMNTPLSIEVEKTDLNNQAVIKRRIPDTHETKE